MRKALIKIKFNSSKASAEGKSSLLRDSKDCPAVCKAVTIKEQVRGQCICVVEFKITNLDLESYDLPNSKNCVCRMQNKSYKTTTI